MHADLVRNATCHVDLWQELKEIVADSSATTTGFEHLRPIFDYAWWCIDGSNNSDLVAAIEAHFYEDLPAYSDTCTKFQLFIDQNQFERLRNSFSARITNEEFESVFVNYDV